MWMNGESISWNLKSLTASNLLYKLNNRYLNDFKQLIPSFIYLSISLFAIFKLSYYYFTFILLIKLFIYNMIAYPIILSIGLSIGLRLLMKENVWISWRINSD